MKLTYWVKFGIVFAVALFLMIMFWMFFFGIIFFAIALIIILGIIIWIWHFLKKVKKKII